MREGLLGWATDALVRADDQTSGLVARVLTAAPARRQAIFAALAAHQVEGGLGLQTDGPFPQELADALRHGRVSDILRRAYGDVPTGFAGTLERIGERPLERAEDYLTIRDLLASDDTRAADALRSCENITRNRLRVLAALDPRWVHVNTLTRLDTTFDAITFNRSVSFVQSVCSRASDEAVAGAIARMVPTSTLLRVVQRFVRRADRLPPHPVRVGDNELRPLLTISDYLEVARRYRNCVASKVGEIAAGRIAIAEFRGEVLLEFRPLSAGAGWMLSGTHGHRNEPVDGNVAEAGAAKCEALGIPRPNENAGGSDWRSYKRFTQQMDWGWAA